MPKKRVTPPGRQIEAANGGSGAFARSTTVDFGLMRVLARSLYSEKKVFIREMLQDGYDSIQVREKYERDHHGQIDIVTRRDEGWISFTDDGMGMSEDDLSSYLSRVGVSSARLERQDQHSSSLIGQFGIGFLSGFIVAEKIEVRTRKLGEDQGWIWRNEGDSTYTVEPCTVESPGTTVKVFIKNPDDTYLLEPDEVIKVVREYCDMLRVPILINQGAAPVNAQIMPWEREGLSDEERDIDCKIYLARTIRGDSLIEAFPVRLDLPAKTGGILYVSKQRTFGIRVPQNLLIFQDRMFVANDPELLPPWAQFVSGIIETTGLTPNAARDGFIRNESWGQLREALGDLIIASMDKLSQTNRKQLTYILKYHDLGIKAACHLHRPFFEKFAHLLEWRVNRLPTATATTDAEDVLDVDGGPGSVAFNWKTLPEVLATKLGAVAPPKRLLTFTSASAGLQYFEIANAANVEIVDASQPFEDELIAAYVKLPGIGPIDLVYVDKGEGGLFDDLQPEDQPIRHLADAMGLVILPGGTGRLKVEARRFQPATLPAVLLNAERGKAVQQARQILTDPNTPASLREMAEELLRNARAANAMRMTINAACPLIQNLAQQDVREPTVRQVMLAVYNCAVLYNAEMLTAHNAKTVHDQFGEFMESVLSEREAFQQERAAMRRVIGIGGPSSSHRIIFLMTPFNQDYVGLEQALRLIVEERWGCQLFLARDMILESDIRENVDAHMEQAHAFFAEVSLGNPNVMYEVGRARALYPQRPMIFLSHPHKDTGTTKLPADLDGLLRLDYDNDATVPDMVEHLDKKLRRTKSIASLLNNDTLGNYIPASKLKLWSRPITLPDDALDLLVARYATAQAWRQAKADEVHKVVAAFDLEPEDVEMVLRKIRRSIGG